MLWYNVYGFARNYGIYINPTINHKLLSKYAYGSFMQTNYSVSNYHKLLAQQIIGTAGVYIYMLGTPLES